MRKMAGFSQTRTNQTGAGLMLTLEWWWALFLLPVPFLARMVLPGSNRSEAALTVPLFEHASVPISSKAQTKRWMPRIALWLFWVFLVLGASRPLWVGEPVTQTISGRDLMLAVDISGSMQEKDMLVDSRAVSRIEVLKTVVSEFIQRREGDRIGLILFGTNAYTYVPLTFDRQTLSELLLDATIGLAGRGTAIGDAIGLAVKRMREREAQQKILILITDGSNTSGITDPIEAAQAAYQEGLKIYTVGVGTDAETMRRVFGIQRIRPGTALDEATLRQIANYTEGEYFRAKDVASLEEIYTTLDELEPIEREDRTYRPRKELFYLPLLAGLFVILALVSWLTFNNRTPLGKVNV